MPLYPSLGFGLGLRVDHYETILNDLPAVDWFEALTENYLVPGGKPLYHLMRIRGALPHGDARSVAVDCSAAALDRAYLDEVQALAKRIEPAWISESSVLDGVSAARTCTTCCPCRTRTRL